MRLTFTKRVGKYDDLLIERPGRPAEAITNPKQGIIPHDMVHYAVESVLTHRGFLSMVAEGEAAGFDAVGGDSEEAVERLVETFQAEMWGGRVPAVELIATYRHACAARGHLVAAVGEDDIAAIRARIDRLSADWAAVPVDGSLVLQF